MKEQRFTEGDLIVHDNENYVCEISDNSVAVFAPWSIQIDAEGDKFESVDYTDMFAVDNNIGAEDGFEYVKIKE